MIDEKTAKDIKKKAEKKLKSKLDKKKEEEDYESTAPYSLKNTESLPVYSTEPQLSISRSILEVYKTDEENWEPYVPNSGSGEEEEDDSDSKETEEETEEEEEEEEEEEDEETEGFKLHQGEILETYYYGDFLELSTEHDYEDISNTGSIKLPEIIDLDRFYKGVRVCLRKTWEAEGEQTQLDDLEEILKSFITEESFTQSGMSLSLSGMSKLLEQNYKFDFHQMKRSEIIKEVIKTAGLKPVVNPEGLNDEVIDFTNISKGKDDEEAGDGVSAGATVDELVKNAIKGKKGALEKAQAIHEALKSHGIVYRYYYNFEFANAEECLKNALSPGLNCGDTSQLTTAAMKSGGLDAHIELRCDSAHFFTVITIGGTKYYSDLTGSSGARSTRPWNEVWEGNKCGNPYSR